MASNKKSKKAPLPMAKPLNHKKQPPPRFGIRLLKILFVVILGIVLAMGIMARIYHYNKYEINHNKNVR